MLPVSSVRKKMSTRPAPPGSSVIVLLTVTEPPTPMVASNEAGVIDAAMAPLAARSPAVARAEEVTVLIFFSRFQSVAYVLTPDS